MTTRNFLAVVMCLVVSSITLLLIESPIKYALYLFEVVLILLLSRVSCNKTIRLNLRTEIGTIHKVDYVFLITATLLCGLICLELGAVLILFCAIIVSFFLPGYVLLRLLNFSSSNSWIEWIVLSFVLSISITSIIFLAILPFTINRTLLLSVISVCMSLCPLLKDHICKHREKHVAPESHVVEYAFPDILILLWVMMFFVFGISILYPQMSICPELDIVRHFSSSKLLALNPDAYSSSYLWFHAIWANVYELSNPSMEVFQTGLAYLSAVVILSFYIMAKSYLHDINRFMPTLATVFFSAFAGFGWLYFLQEKITAAGAINYYDLLIDASNRSYFDVGYAQGWIWFWFRPLTLGLTLFFVLLYLLQNHRLEKKAFIFIFTSLLVTLNFVHFPESVVFILFLLFLGLLKPMYNLRLTDAAISSVLALLTSLPLLCVFQDLIGASVIGPPIEYVGLLILPSILTVFLTLLKKRPKIKLNSLITWIIIGISIIYVWLMLTWLYASADFTVASVTPAYSVPSEFYPMFFGLIGLFALISSVVIVKHYFRHPIVIFLILLFFSVLFGRLLTCYNLNVSNPSYFERRIVPIAYSAVAIIASLSVIRLFNHVQKHQPIVLTMILSFLVVFSISSTFLALELQTYNVDNYALNDDELNLVNRLNELTPDKILLASTSASRSLAEFSPSRWIIDKYRYQLWSATCPELPLNVLYSMNKPVALLLQEEDIQEINENYASSYLYNHLVLSAASTNCDIPEILSLPNMTAPSSNSQTILVLPNHHDSVIWYAYDLLSQAKLNYTTALVDDITTISQANTLIAPTEKVAQRLISYHELLNLNFENLIILNLDGYAELSSNYFFPQMILTLDGLSQDVATAEIDEISGSNSSISLDTKITVSYLPTQDGTIAWYENDVTSIPFAIEDNSNGFEMLYVNIYPLITSLVSDMKNYESIRQISNVLNLNHLIVEANMIDKNPVSGDLATFNKLDFEGNATFHSHATTIINKVNSSIDLTLSDITITNLSKILLIGDKITLNTKEGTISSGMGFYSNIYSDYFAVTSTGTAETIMLEFVNGTTQEIHDLIQNICIHGDSVVTLRQPTIGIQGRIVFYNLYTYASLSDLGIFGSGASLDGTVAFDLTFGDEFMVTKNFDHIGQITVAENHYDELAALSNSFPVFIIAGMIVIIAYILVLVTIKKPAFR